MKILSLDPATTTGFCICDIEDNETVVIKEMGAFKIEVKKYDGDLNDFTGKTCNNMYEKVEKLVTQYSPDLCVIEDYFFSNKNRNGSSLNIYLRGAIFMLLDDYNIRYRKFSPTHWKTFITGTLSGKPSKARIARDGKAAANKTVVYDSLVERYNIQFPPTTTINGKTLKFKYDVSDAVGIALFGVHLERPHAVFPHHKTLSTS